MAGHTPRKPVDPYDRTRPLEPPENGEVRDFLDSRRMRRWIVAHIKPYMVWGFAGMALVAALRDQFESILRLVKAILTGGGAS